MIYIMHGVFMRLSASWPKAQPGARAVRQGVQSAVRQWGPVANRALFGSWHHLALTLRFARAPTSRAATPTALLAQAFLFLDGSAVPATVAAALGPSSGVGIDTGLDEVYFGGLPAALSGATAAALRGFEGMLDNVRIWWPPCPSAGDPSRCRMLACRVSRISLSQ